MNEISQSYRFSLRDLFLFTLACSLLLFEWKMWGVASLLGTLTTLVCGAVFAWCFVAYPFKNSPRLTMVGLALALGNFILIFLLKHQNSNYFSYLDWTSMSQENYVTGMVIAFLSLLLTTAIAVWLLGLMMKPNRSWLLPLLILLNVWLGYLLVWEIVDMYHNYSPRYGEELMRGYGIAMLVFLVPLVLRWVKSLPTARDDLAR
jgi:hypothetical protein